MLVYNRDRDSGRVTIDKDGAPEIHYWPSAFDLNNMMNVRKPSSPPRPILSLPARSYVGGFPTCMTFWTAKYAGIYTTPLG